MPLEVKILTVALIALLVAGIAVYHVWLDRRLGVGKTASPPRPTHVRAVPNPTSAAPAPPSGTRPRRTPTRRTR
jgi:hypothetical protein